MLRRDYARLVWHRRVDCVGVVGMMTVKASVSDISVGDAISLPITTYPPFWAFWRKPVTKPVSFKVVSVANANGYQSVGLA